jgi:molecular chaperone DnaJ
LFVVLFIEKHKIFKRDGADLFAEIPISFSEAALGAEIEAPTLKNTVKLTIPTGTQTGTIFRLKGKGIKHLDSNSFGDEFIKVFVQTPKDLTKEQKKIFEELLRLNSLKEKRKSIFDRFK